MGKTSGGNVCTYISGGKFFSSFFKGMYYLLVIYIYKSYRALQGKFLQKVKYSKTPVLDGDDTVFGTSIPLYKM